MPTPLRLVTWNINSVRIRLDLVDRLITDHAPDAIALQEIKCESHVFPAQWFEDHGYVHQAVHGQKGYHGVATVSRVPLDNVERIDWCGKGDARHVAATLPGGTVLHNFYVPAGGDVPDPKENDKFAHKLAFMDEMTAWGATLKGAHILVGDLNVAPLEHDVWSHKKLLKVVSHTPIEVARMDAMIAAHGWVDVMREFVDVQEKLYTWWSYRARDWRAANKGRRLDHVWTSPSLKGRATKMLVDLEARGYDKPSDHAPVIVDFEL